MGLVPLQSWLPLAHPEAPSSISGPLSGILTKAGLFGMVKVLYVVFGASALTRFAFQGIDVSTVLMVLGCLTLIYGEIRALFEPELKRMLAFSTLAQIGEITAILAIGTALANDASLLHLTNHAVMKTLLFYGAGAFLLQDRRAAHRGPRRPRPRDALHRRLLRAGKLRDHGLAAVLGLRVEVPDDLRRGRKRLRGRRRALLLGGIIGVVYYTRVVSFLFYHPYKGEEGVREAPAAMLAAMGVLAAAIVFGGFAPGYQLSLIAQVGDLAALRSALTNLPLPGLVTDWPIGASIAMAGAVVVLLVGRASVAWAGRLAVLVLLAALGGVIFEAGRYDLLSFCFAVLIAGVGALNMLHSTAYLAHSHAQGRFFAAFTVMIAGLLGMTQAKDIFSFFAFWELMSSWALWAAIAHEETAGCPARSLQILHFQHRWRELPVPRPDAGRG